MVSQSTNVQSQRQHRSKKFFFLRQEQVVHLLVRSIPKTFDWLFQYLNQYHLLIMVVAALLFFSPLVTMRLPIWQQGIVTVFLIFTGRFILDVEEQQTDNKIKEHLHLFLMIFSLFATLRYLYYRTLYTVNLDSIINAFFSLLLYTAEMYGIATLVLAYFQTSRINHRKPIDLSNMPPEQLPSVDIYIPTYNEDVEIVRKTILGALAIDYPADKKQVYVLDDGRAEKYRARREQLRQTCEELGCAMLTRDNNEHAKAGNINTALKKTYGDLVMILDCDHIPTRIFLQETVGFFLNSNVALVQTPHWFYNPDPFERNLLTRGKVPVGNELFYKVLQKGNDFWNAAFFCGSAAIVRKEYLLQIGGIATETVTEDCHTSLRLHSLGYETVYYDKIMVAGLAPEKFSAYVGQQVRWARGMAQILRTENPLLNRKLKLTIGQRLCYFSATSHFFFGFPRLMYAIAPNLFLLFGISSVRGLGIETLFYALPHIILSMQANHIPYKHVRFSFWNEIYEFAMSFQAGIVTLLAMINPKLGKFNVTDKGLVVNKRSFDLDSVRYIVILAALTGASLISVPFWLVLRPLDAQAVLINSTWGIFNLLLVLAACLVAFEQPQLRRAHRLPRKLTAVIHSGQQSWVGTTVNVSETGAQILLDVWPNVPDEVRVEIVGDFGAKALLDARVIRAVATDKLQTILAVDFSNPSRGQLDDLIVVIYSDVREWYSQKRAEFDQPIQSLRFIASSLGRAFRELRPETGMKVRKQVEAIAQLYWEGWKSVTYSGRVTELGTQDLRVELEYFAIPKLEQLQQTRPIIGLLLSRNADDPTPSSILARVEQIEQLPGGLNTYPVINAHQLPAEAPVTPQRVAIELSFPQVLDRQQRRKIRELLRSLD